MPVNVVRTAREERLWDKAKRIAASAGRDKDYQYIMGIFKKMLPGRFDKKAEIMDKTALTVLLEKIARERIQQEYEEALLQGFLDTLESMEKEAFKLNIRRLGQAVLKKTVKAKPALGGTEMVAGGKLRTMARSGSRSMAKGVQKIQG